MWETVSGYEWLIEGNDLVLSQLLNLNLVRIGDS